MKVTATIEGKKYTGDLNKPIDLSIVTKEKDSCLAWHVPHMKITPVITDRFIGSVQKGGFVNFRNIIINPHGNCTHTESVGHISNEAHSVNNILKKFNFISQLLSVEPKILEHDISNEQKKGDLQIDRSTFEGKISDDVEALIIRTHPNNESKKNKNYNNTNWPYLTPEAAKYLRENGVLHLLIDLPSVDREEDEGKLLSHRAFWNYPEQIDLIRTITELIYVPEHIQDGFYMLNLSFANICNDASPSRPIIYELNN